MKSLKDIDEFSAIEDAFIYRQISKILSPKSKRVCYEALVIEAFEEHFEVFLDEISQK